MSKLLKLVQIGKRELQLSDEAYRDLLEEVTGQRSSRGLDDFKLSKMVDRMKQMGFVPVNKNKVEVKKFRAYESEKILAIWITMFKQGFVRNGNDAALDAYVKRMTSQINGAGVAKLAWLDSDQATYVLEALKKWHYRMMCDAIVAAGGRVPKNDNCTGPASYDKLAWFYENDFKGNNK
ncbi:regulatory protein GemA [Vibrio paracholerae]|uniref:gp16 family protein n=1 Tax=Vibrio paracholerae TaxID=650003 RepID=UPI0020947675|nr:regulatory protein GemA [Vibrio paracholerae]MCO7025100.1 regulatory protein GemA [Vibrio paracholerae]